MTVMTVMPSTIERDGSRRVMTVDGRVRCTTVTGIHARGDRGDGRDGRTPDRSDRVQPGVASPVEAFPLDPQATETRRQPLEGLGQGPRVLRPLALAGDILAAGHAFTTAGAPIACAAAIATLDVVRDEKLAENAHAQGDLIMKGLRDMSSRHRLIGEVRGAGLIIGVEMVLDPVTKAPATQECAKLVIRCQQLGLLVHYVGIFSHVIELTPPLVLTQAEAEAGLEIFDRALTDVEEGRVADSELDAVSGW